MKSKNGLNAEILKITMIIEKNVPELSKYISEMNNSLTKYSEPKITLNTLKDYYDSIQ